MKKILPILLFFLFTITALAKNNTVEGRILKEGKALSGVSVWTVGTEGKPVKTNKRGNFRIAQTMPEDSLFVYVMKLPTDHTGWVSKLFTIPLPFSDKNIVNIQLTNEYELSDISIERAKNENQSMYGGTIVTRESLEQTGEKNLLRAIAMKVAGVEYRNGNLIIRGVGTIKLSSYPLYVINGVQTYDASYLTVLEVESIEVIKDTNTSMFGVKGANGVVIINLR